MSITMCTRTERLQKVPLFKIIEREAIERMAAQSRELQVNKGDVLFQKDDVPNGFYYLVEGCINLCFPSEHGAERVLEVIRSGETFGEALMFLHRPYPVYALAAADSNLLHIPEKAVDELLDRDCRLARNMLAGISIRLHELIGNLEARSMRTSAQRVACMLQHYAPEKGLQCYEIELPAAKHTVASQLNLTPETFSRVLHVLTEEGLIEVSGRKIQVLDADGLRNLKI